MKTKKPKVRLWSVLTALTAILTIAAIVGNMIANQYATTLNVALNASTYKIIKGDTTEDTEYFKAGFASDEEREAYEAELCATVEAEGAALLKNDNAALPLAGNAKVSLFGHGSVDLMYGGTGSGSVDTSKAPNLKQALEAQGIQVNQTLWDLYKSDSMMKNYSRITPASISDTLEANTQYKVNEAPWSALSSAESSFAEYGDAAIVVFSRSGGEGADLPSGTNGTNDSWISGTEGSGNYIPGIMGTLFSLVDKLVSSLSATVVGIAVSFVGLQSLPTQYDPYTPGMNWVVIVLFCIIPMVAWAATLIAMKGYTLTGAKMKEIQAVNACRRDAVAKGMKLEEAMDKWQTMEQLPEEYRA